CVHHTLAVLAAALAMKGHARAPAAAAPTDPRSTERLLNLRMPFSLVSPCPAKRFASEGMQFRKVSDLIGTAKRQPSPERYGPPTAATMARRLTGISARPRLKRRFPDGPRAYPPVPCVANGKKCAALPYTRCPLWLRQRPLRGHRRAAAKCQQATFCACGERI